MVLTKMMHCGNGGQDTLYGQDGADIFILKQDTAFDAVTVIDDFDTAEGDVINLSDILDMYDPLTDVLTDFVQITDNGTDSSLAVDIDGGADNFVQIATLLNVTGLTDEDALVTSNNLSRSLI